jgi:NAD(P)-dependent dehydrogenase (short-subunit alcohol dehydrogenase family)
MKNILITGCSSGFGRQLVDELAAKQWRVIATLRRASDRQALFETTLSCFGSQVVLLDLDVTQPSERRAVGKWIEENAGGHLDCLINNAGYGLFGALEDLSENQIRAQMETNFFGAAFLIKELLPALRAARGRVLNVSSECGYTGLPLASLYCASKFALEGLSEALAHELQPHGVQVCCVEPGEHRTDFSDNMAWGERTQHPQSVYSGQTLAHRSRLQEQRAKEGTSPAKVIAKIVQLADEKKLPLRVRCGPQATPMEWMKKILPVRWSGRAFTALFRQLRSTTKVDAEGA